MPPRLYKATEVCEMAQLQPFVLRSWEKEFPGIGQEKSDGGTRVYRQSDVDQLLRIKQLVFGEGLTLGGARRRLETVEPVASTAEDAEEAVEVFGAEARERIGSVRDGLRSLLQLLDGRPAEFTLAPPPGASSRTRASAQRGKSPARGQAVSSGRGTAASKRTPSKALGSAS